MTKSKIVPILEVLFTVIVWGASFIATKVALRDLSPVTLVWMRFGIGVFILGLATLARRQFALPARNELGYLALVGFLGITLHQWLQSTGLQTAQATTTGWIIASILMWLASILLVGSFFKNPALVGAPGPRGGPTGVMQITRHPMMWAFALWAIVHLAVVEEPPIIADMLRAGAVGCDRPEYGPTTTARVARRPKHSRRTQRPYAEPPFSVGIGS